MKHGKILLAAGLLLGLNHHTARAALESRAGGTMVYDTDRDITWIADANLFKTQAGNNSNLVSQIIAANSGLVHDAPNFFDGNDGVYNLSTGDFNTNTGAMSWFGAMAWVNSLNYAGYTDWRLPTTNLGAIAGYNQTESELGHLLFNELEGDAGHSIFGSHDPDFNLFRNVQYSAYWSATEYALDPFFSWRYDTTEGLLQALGNKNFKLHAWAVRDGDVTDITSVPVPGAIWLFGSAILGFTGLKRLKS